MHCKPRRASLLVITFAFLLPSLTMGAVRDFDVPAGRASQTLSRLAQQAGIPIVFPYELTAERRTRRVRGRLDTDIALQRMLRGSGLAARRDDTGQIVIEAARSRSRVRPLPAQRPEAAVTETVRGDLDEVHITGSRIDPDGMTTPTPVTSISRDELQLLSTGTLAEALVELPYFLNNDTPQSQSYGTSAAAGASHLNLRGIGSIRTLTLLDGRRIVPATRFGTVDYALLPKALVRRVEVVTGGASAAYGSDAVSGVVNLLLDSSFEGVRAQVQTGLSDRGDSGNVEVSLTHGARISENSHLVVAGEFHRANGVRGYDSRDWFDSWATIANPDPTGPREITVRGARATNYTYGGLITTGPLAGTQFLPGGEPAPFERGDHYTGLTQAGGDGIDPAADLVWLMPDQTRASVFAKFITEVAAGRTVFAQVLAGRSDNGFDKDPASLWSSWEATIFPDNAFLHESIREQMVAHDIPSFGLARMGNGDLGRGRVHHVGDLLSATVGGTQRLGAWQLDGYYQYGQNRNRLHYSDTLRIDRVYRGVDSVVNPLDGQIVCRSTLTFPDDGCVPVNLFGDGSVSAAARAYVTAGEYAQLQKVTEQVAEITTVGPLLALPAGNLQFAAGANWRREAVENTPRRYPDNDEPLAVPPPWTQGYYGLPFGYFGAGNVFERVVENNVSGGYGVWEVFAEAAAPLLTGQPLAHDLTLHGALRLARYSGSGVVTAWKGGIDWSLHSDLRLRGTRSRDVRAGSLSERFDVNSGGISIFDPALPATPNYVTVSTRSGNPNVEPELADTWTAGLVYRPAVVPGLSVSADYYDIRIRNAISLMGVQNIINRCQAGNTEICSLITRSATNNRILRVNNPVLNIAGARSRGVDLELGWRQPVTLFGGDESVALRAFGNRVLESSVSGASGIKVDRVYQTGLVGGAPAWQANVSLAYRRGPLQLALQQRMISRGKFNAFAAPDALDINQVSGASYTNLRGSWTSTGLPGFTFHAQASNLFDRNPPLAPDWGFIGSVPTNETLFDVIGRRYVIGFTYQRD